jgi:hypothetical protein
MPLFGSRKREREYEKLKGQFQRSGRYGRRAKEVAARIVNKQRAEKRETKDAGPQPDLPIANYDKLNVPEVKRRLERISAGDLHKIKRYEQRHKQRKTLLAEIDKRL